MSKHRPTKLRRTWPQRLTVVFATLAALACFVTATVLASGQWVLSQRQLIELAAPESQSDDRGGDSVVIVPGATSPATTAPPVEDDEPAAATTTLPLAEPDAANFLITGADNGNCGDDPTATIGDRDDLGERSDTIMIWRANPNANQLAVLSLPRDLYVDIAGGRRARINSAYRADDPTRLIDTIYLNFGIPIDHYIQVDFCAFRALVNAVGGVTIPFDAPARDTRSGLDIPEAGCIELDGDMALAYVRSRHYTYEDPVGSGNWTQDGTSDFGRIARQQDFLRRLVAKVIDDGQYSPSVAGALIETNREYLVTDVGLTVRRMLEFANTLRNLDPSEIATYRIESYSETRGGQSVEIPAIRGDNMQAILAVFRGEAMLAAAPEQVFDDANTTTTSSTSTSVADASGSTTLPEVVAEDNTIGVVPGAGLDC
jgi:LCP family protein required for cell wall assembly